MTGNKFATGEMLRKPVEVVKKGRIFSWLSSKASRTLLGKLWEQSSSIGEGTSFTPTGGA